MAMRIFSILACLFVVSTALAQQSGEAKKRLLFSNTSPTPASTPAANMEPAELLQRFFEALKADKLDAAYEGLAKNTLVASKAEKLEQLKKRTRDDLDNFGPVKG